jgi:hypothetical protein
MKVSEKKELYSVSLFEDYYYQRAFQHFEKGGKVRWNWMAFFFNSLWMIYRRMYLYALVYFILFISGSSYPTLFVMFITGMLANRFYYSWLLLRDRSAVVQSKNTDVTGVVLFLTCFTLKNLLSFRGAYFEIHDVAFYFSHIQTYNLQLQSISSHITTPSGVTLLLTATLSAITAIYFFIQCLRDIKIIILAFWRRKV